MGKGCIICICLVIISSLFAIESSAAEVSGGEYNDIYWHIEDNYAVIDGNIYDERMELSSDAGITKMVIPAEINGYPVKVFNGPFDMWSPETILLPEGLEIIRTEAFTDSPIKQITIPSTVISIEEGAFRYCSNLEWIDVKPDNNYYISINGILFNKACEELICYPAKLNVDNMADIMPSELKTIKSYAFTSAEVVDLVFPEGLQYIETNAFVENHIDNIYFPSSLGYIETHSFLSNFVSNIFFEAKELVIEDEAFYGNSPLELYFYCGNDYEYNFLYDEKVANIEETFHNFFVALKETDGQLRNDKSTDHTNEKNIADFFPDNSQLEALVGGEQAVDGNKGVIQLVIFICITCIITGLLCMLINACSGTLTPEQYITKSDVASEAISSDEVESTNLTTCPGSELEKAPLNTSVSEDSGDASSLYSPARLDELEAPIEKEVVDIPSGENDFPYQLDTVLERLGDVFQENQIDTYTNISLNCRNITRIDSSYYYCILAEFSENSQEVIFVNVYTGDAYLACLNPTSYDTYRWIAKIDE